MEDGNEIQSSVIKAEDDQAADSQLINEPMEDQIVLSPSPIESQQPEVEGEQAAIDFTEDLDIQTKIAERSRSRSRSPIKPKRFNPKKCDPKQDPTKFIGCKVLYIRNLPFSWTQQQVEEYIKKKTSANEAVFKDIKSIVLNPNKLRNGVRITKVLFSTAAMCNAAKILITPEKIGSCDIFTTFPKRAEVTDKSDEFRVLIMNNVPAFWTKSKVQEYVAMHVNDDEVMKGLQYIYMEKVDNKYTGTCVVRFASKALAAKALAMLKKVPWCPPEKKIWVNYDFKKTLVIWKRDNTPDFQLLKLRDRQRKIQNPNQSHIKPENKTWQKQTTVQCFNDRRGFQNFQNDLNSQEQHVNTYGLSMQFLDSLGIKPPLGTRIYVSNLSTEYDDELKIRKLFGHAGTIVSVNILRKPEILKLRIEYDHPVEAVQAISMFHEQEVYGKKLLVGVDWDQGRLPEGLKAFGPGLGFNGLPMKNIRNSIEIQNLKNTLMNEIQNVAAVVKQMNDNSMFNDTQSQTSTMGQMNMQNAVAATLNSTIANPVQNPLLSLNNLLNPQTIQMLQLLQQNTAAANLGTLLTTTQSQGLNPQGVAGVTNVGWNTQSQSANTQTQGLNTQGVAGLTNVGWNTQIQSANIQSGLNMDVGTNIPGVTNMQIGRNMQDAPNNQRGMNMQDGPNNQRGMNMQDGPNNQRGINMQDGPNSQRGNNMRGGPNRGANMQPEPDNMQGLRQQNNFGGGSSKFGNSEPDERGRNLMDDKTTVVFNYLPPSVTLDALKSKMLEVGEVKMAELTGPGRAIVMFWSHRDAQSCIKLLDRTKVDGQTIEVRYF